jgi:hypothetical protein
MVYPMNQGLQAATADARERAYARPPPDRYHCWLDDQPGFLVPSRLAEPRAHRPDAELPSWMVNPALWLSRFGAPPPWLSGAVAQAGWFDWSEEAVWVSDPVRGGLLPFTAGPTVRPWLDGLWPGQPVPRPLPEPLWSALAAAEVLVAPEDLEQRRVEWQRRLGDAAALFRQGYAPLAGLIHPFHVGALRRHYRWLIRSGHLKLGDGQSPRRYVAHNESVARFFHHQLTPVVSAVVGRPVRPSYVYVASYRGGAELPRHLDRPQCEYSVTFLLDYAPEPELEAPWPLRLELGSGELLTVYQAIGDGLLYRGRVQPHQRDRLPEGHSSTSLLFHYVDEDYHGALD